MDTETKVTGRTELATESRDQTLDSGECQQTNLIFALSYLDTRGMLMMVMSRRDAEMLIFAADEMSQSLHGIQVERADEWSNRFYVTEA